MTQSHLVRSELEALAGGDVDEPIRDSWIDHLSRCDRCFEAFDEEWEMRLPGGLRISEAEAEILGDMPGRIAERVESELFSRIHLADLASSASWFATTGFLEVVLCLLQPLVGFDRSHERTQEVEK